MAQKAPDAVKRLLIDPVKGAEPGAFLEVARAVGLEGKTAELAAAYFEGLCRLFEDKDASLIEINPLAVLADGTVCALDAKMILTTTRFSGIRTLQRCVTSHRKTRPK